MRQILFLGLGLIGMLITSCDFYTYEVPDSIFETTWTTTITDSENVTTSSVLKFSETTYNITTTYIKDKKAIVLKENGSYIYNTPTVTMVTEGKEELNIITGTIRNGKMHIIESNAIYKKQL